MNREIYQQASEWLVELRVGEVDGAQREKLDAWFRASPEHIRAFLELSAIWEEGADRDLNRSYNSEELIARARASTSNVVALDTAGEPAPAIEASTAPDRSVPRMPLGHSDSPQRIKRSKEHLKVAFKRTGARRLSLAAGVAFVAVVTAAWVLYGSPTYSTGTGEQRSVELPDGSTIQLNARSRVRVNFSKGERDVELLAGQALFKVAKDVSRPFVVKSDATRVRAVGTQFDVYRKVSGTIVTVLEGRVAILPRSMQESPRARPESRLVAPSDLHSNTDPILVSAGEQVTVTASQVEKPPHADVAAATAWTQRELVFDSTPLAEVASEFNRYNDKPLVVSDESLKNFHVTGVFSSTNPASLLRFLRSQRGIRVEESESATRILKE